MKFRKNYTFLTFVNDFYSLIARNFLEFMRILCRSTTNLRKLIFFRWNSHFFNLKCKFFISRHNYYVLLRFLSKLWWAKYAMTNWFKYCRSILLIIFWHIVETFVSSNDIIVYLYNLYRVRKAIFHFFSIFILI